MKLIQTIKDVIKASKCEATVTFVKVNADGRYTDVVIYNAGKVWSNQELVDMNNSGYVVVSNG